MGSMIPEYRVTDGRRTAFGNWIAARLPVFVRLPRGWMLALTGCEFGAVYVRKELMRTTPYGLRIGSMQIASKPWGMATSRRIGGLFIGR